DVVGTFSRDIEDGSTIHRDTHCHELVGNKPGTEIGGVAGEFWIFFVELAETACRGSFPPMRRVEPGHTTALLIDEDLPASIADGFPKRLAQGAQLLRIGDISGEQNEPERACIFKETALVGEQFGTKTAIDCGSRRHPSLIGSTCARQGATKQVPPSALSLSQ